MLELSRRVLECLDSGDREGLFALTDPDIVLATDPSWPGGGEYRGMAAYRRFMDDFFDTFDEVRFVAVAEPEVVEDWLLLRGHWTGTGVSSGIETSSEDFTMLNRAANGLMTDVRAYFDDAKAREYASST